MRQHRFEVNCWSKRYEETTTVAAQVAAALEMAGPGSIDRVLPDGATDLHEESIGQYRRSLDFLVFEP